MCFGPKACRSGCFFKSPSRFSAEMPTATGGRLELSWRWADGREGPGAGPLGAVWRAAARAGGGSRSGPCAARPAYLPGTRHAPARCLLRLLYRPPPPGVNGRTWVCMQVDALDAGTAAWLASQGVQFPLVLKPEVACGQAAAHRMALVLAPGGLAGAGAVALPAVAQAFVDHGGVVHKVYVIGRAVSPGS